MQRYWNAILFWFLGCLMIPYSASAQTKATPAANAAPRLKECAIEEAVRRKYPEQIVLVTSVGSNRPPNIITLGWMMFTSGEPPLLAISVGKTRHSHALIQETEEFVCAFPGSDLKEAVLFCGTRSGREVDKFKATGLTPVKAKQVKPPLIGECLVNLECKVRKQIATGDHTIFVGEIVAAWRQEPGEGQKRLFNLGEGHFDALP